MHIQENTTHEKPFLLNNAFKAVASNVSSGSLPAGSAVLHKQMYPFRNREKDLYRDRNDLGLSTDLLTARKL
jgi:hypothetical protein